MLIAGGVLTDVGTIEASMEIPKKVKSPYDIAVPVLGIHLNG